MPKRIVFLCISLAAWLFGTPAEGAEFHCAAGDVACLIDAINQSNANGEANTIHLEAGTYSLTSVADTADRGTGLPTILGSVAIKGAGADATFIERAVGAPSFRLFRIDGAGKLQLSRVTATGGSAQAFVSGGEIIGGGGILSRGTLAISESVIRANSGLFAAAIQILDGGLDLIDSRITGHKQNTTGILEVGGSGPSTGAPRIVNIIRSSISGNVCCQGDLSGDVISISGAWTVTIRDSAVVGNGGLWMGAALVLGGGATITNTTITGNNAGIFGHPISAGAVTITNSTITDHFGGLHGGPFRLQNTILSGNGLDGECRSQRSGVTGNVVSLGHNLFGKVVGEDCGNLLSTDRVLCTSFECSAFQLIGAHLGPFIDSGRPGGVYVPLVAGSGAIDAGDSTGCVENDQRGLARGVDGNGDGIRGCDIGAVEFYPNVNDRLQLTGLQYSFVKPSNLGFSDPRASAGAFRITASFRNVGPDICHVAFDVPTLDGPAGTNPVLLTAVRELLGGQGTAVPAAKAGAQPHLPSGSSQSYQFTIGVQQRTPINFLVNALGDATSGLCGQ